MITEERRHTIHGLYWDKSFNEQRDWLLQAVNVAPVLRERIRSGKERLKKRSCNSNYFLTNEDGKEEQVCSQFFLSTLGYTSDKKILCLFKRFTPGHISAPKDQRGKNEPFHKMLKEYSDKVTNHINSLHSSVFHYRRKHAPLRRYSSPELSIKLMHDDFISKNPLIKVNLLRK